MISQTTIDKVKGLKTSEVIGHYIKLRRSGSQFVGCCPFHSDRSPSLSVNDTKSIWKCFSCQDTGGDAIGFVERLFNLSYAETIEKIAADNNIQVEYIRREMTDEERAAAKRRESLLIAVEQVRDYFAEQLMADTEEADKARTYLFRRWSPEFCKKKKMGFAPSKSRDFINWVRSKCIPMEALMALDIVRHNKERGYYYPFFRNRITMPIKSATGRTIAFTARVTDNSDPKYLNSSESELFNKSEVLFGLHEARSDNRSKDYVLVVEGAPDVYRLQSIGLNNAVASLGTSFTDDQFELLRNLTGCLCFIPDSDVPTGGAPYGPGFAAVLRNGEVAIRKGFDVSVRQLPQTEPLLVPMFDYELDEQLARGVPENKLQRWRVIGRKYAKHDADSYITSVDVFNGLEELPFAVWMARIEFPHADSLSQQQRLIKRIAALLALISDELTLKLCIERIAKIYGKPKLWRDAVAQAKGEAQRERTKRIEAEQTPEGMSSDEREKEIASLRQFNLSIRDNCYFTYEEDEPTRLSNFILRPMFHITDEANGTRLFEMINRYNDRRYIELKESDLCSLATFQQRVGSLGNFIWRAKIDKLNNVKEHIYSRTSTAVLIKKMGWDAANEFYAFGNGLLTAGRFIKADEMGIVKLGGKKAFYIPAASSIYANSAERYQFERLFVHEERSGLRLRAFIEKLESVFGDNAKIGFCYLLAAIFRDIIFSRCRHFPLLNLFGEKGSGKTTLATSLQSFFIHGIDPPNLGTTTIASLNDRVSQSVNAFVVFDEYKNGLDVRKVDFCKGLWGGGGQTKKNVQTDGMAQQTIVTSAIALCGQDKPDDDIALFTRVIHLAFTKTSFSKEERARYEDLQDFCKLGNTHLLIEVLGHRALFEQNYNAMHSAVKAELTAFFENEKIHDRVFGNWIIPLAAFRTLENVLDMPFSYSDLFGIAVAGMRAQNELCKDSSEIGDFWKALKGAHGNGKVIAGAHFKIFSRERMRFLNTKEATEFGRTRTILEINMSALEQLFCSRGQSISKASWNTITSYLRTQPSFLGTRQERFTLLLPNGQPDAVNVGIGVESVRKIKTSKFNCYCFDYDMVRREFGINLTEELVAESDFNNDDADGTSAAPTAPPAPPTPPKPEPSVQYRILADDNDEFPF